MYLVFFGWEMGVGVDMDQRHVDEVTRSKPDRVESGKNCTCTCWKGKYIRSSSSIFLRENSTQSTLFAFFSSTRGPLLAAR